MKIESVTINNWRSIKDIKIDFQDLIIFIGQNNHGKSNVISALLFFFNYISCENLDFNEGEETSKLYVEVSFRDLDSNERAKFQKYLAQEGRLSVRKEALKEGNCQYYGYANIPTKDWLKESHVSNYLTRDSAKNLPLYDLLPPAGKITKDAFTILRTVF